jgi:hypothetical protein
VRRDSVLVPLVEQPSSTRRISMFRSSLRATSVVACSTLLISSFLIATHAFAHGVAGKRVFPATLTIDDPAVSDELALPTIQYQRHGASDDDGALHQTDISAEYSKTITEHLGISIAPSYTILDRVGQNNSYGFGNIETTLKYQFLQNAPHELLMSVGVSREWGGSGAQSIGAERIGSTTPTLFFGKGFGDLPDSLNWLKPLAITGIFGYQFSDAPTTTTTVVDDDGNASLSRDHNPDLFVYGASLQYSIPYLQANVKDLGLPEFLGRMTPLVEFAYTSPATTSNGVGTKGTIAPGIAYSGENYQLTAEAVIPATRRSNVSTGFIVQVHFFLDDVFSNSLGKPIVDWFN